MIKPPHVNPSVLAPGKVFVSGDYSVLVGGWAVVATVRVHARASIAPATSKRRPDDRFASEILRQLAPPCMKSLERRRQRIALDLSSFREGRVKLGVGSSAAGAAAVAGLAEVLHKGRVGRRDILARRCAILHRKLQDRLGSGADAAACCRGGVIRFRMPTTLRPFRLPDWLHLVAVVLGGGGRTSRVLKRHAEKIEARERSYLLNIDVFGEAADRILDAMLRDDWHSLRLGVNLAAAAYDELADLLGAELITPADSIVMSAARRLGGVSRPSGAGGGDLHLAYFPEHDLAERFVRWAQGRGYRMIAVEPDPLGVHIEKKSQR